ncbi:MAG: hypothetical protein ACPLPS_02330 [bacterium]
MKKLLGLFLVVLFALSLNPLSLAQEKVNLEYKFQEGQTIFVLVLTQGQVNFQMPQSVQEQGVPPAFPINMALLMSMKTLKTYSDGAADIEFKFLDGKIEVMGQQTPMPPQMASQSFRLRMGKKGNVIKLLTPLPTGQLSPFAGFDPNTMIQSMSILTVFPEEAVGVGDKWEKKLDLNLPFGKMTMLYKMNLTNFLEVENRKLAKIAFEMPPTPFAFAIPLSMGMPGPQLEVAQQQATAFNLTGEMQLKGEMLFDYNKGQIDSQVGSLKLTMEMGAPATSSAPPGGLNISAIMKFKATFTEKKPNMPQNLSQIKITFPEEQNQQQSK